MADRKLKKEEIEELEKKLKLADPNESDIKQDKILPVTNAVANTSDAKPDKLKAKPEYNQKNKPENKNEDVAKGGLNDPAISFSREGRRTVKCSNCKEIVTPVNEMCPSCSHYIKEREMPTYEPISDKTTRKIRRILFFVLIGVFIVLVAFGVVKLGGN